MCVCSRIELKMSETKHKQLQRAIGTFAMQLACAAGFLSDAKREPGRAGWDWQFPGGLCLLGQNSSYCSGPTGTKCAGHQRADAIPCCVWRTDHFAPGGVQAAPGHLWVAVHNYGGAQHGPSPGCLAMQLRALVGGAGPPWQGGRAGNKDSHPSIVKVPVLWSTRMVNVSFSRVRMVSVESCPADGTKPGGALAPWAATPPPDFDSNPNSDITFSISMSWFARVSLLMVGSLTNSGSISAGAASAVVMSSSM